MIPNRKISQLNIDLMLTKVDFTIYIQKLKQIIMIIISLKKKNTDLDAYMKFTVECMLLHLQGQW